MVVVQPLFSTVLTSCLGNASPLTSKLIKRSSLALGVVSKSKNTSLSWSFLGWNTLFLSWPLPPTVISVVSVLTLLVPSPLEPLLIEIVVVIVFFTIRRTRRPFSSTYSTTSDPSSSEFSLVISKMSLVRFFGESSSSSLWFVSGVSSSFFTVSWFSLIASSGCSSGLSNLTFSSVWFGDFSSS